jgi:dTDP-4-dehydrorhamnose 3,5-epimerase
MIFAETPLPGAFVIDVEPVADERGSFARTFSRDEFEEHGLNAAVVQCNVSFNARRGTLRGMHYQADPYGECKLVRCTLGAIYDVIVDLRPESPAYCRWFAVELTAENRRMLYIPEGLAHGFQTLADGSEVFYQMSQSYAPSHARGVRWDDPSFGIRWPDAERIMSERDRTYPNFRP